MMNKIIIIGHGGHAKSVVDTIERQGIYKIVGYIVPEKDNNQLREDYPIIGTDNDLERIYLQGVHNVAMGIGYLGNSFLRLELYNKLKKIGYKFPVIKDPASVVSDKAIIKEGVFIGKGAIINRDVEIYEMCIINTGAIIEHECLVKAFSHISVGTILCGNVCVGEFSFIGANATIIQGREISNNKIIGAGEVVRKNI